MIPQTHNLDLLQRSLLNGEFSCVELLDHYLAHIDRSTDHNIYTAVYRDEARRQAGLLDKKLAGGERPPLFGAIISLKDNIAYADHPLTAASDILQGYISPFSATAVSRLIAAGAIIIGHCNCDSFGMGSSSESTPYGPVRNWADPAFIAGGSSGGCAVAVKAGTCLASLGSDTGGSIRQPAAYCSLIGIKPSYGLVSRYGLIAYASSLDQIGVISNDIPTGQKILQTISGSDAEDQSSLRLERSFWKETFPKKTLRLACFTHLWQDEEENNETTTLYHRLQGVLETKGIEVVVADFPLLRYAVPAYYVIATAEASSNLARYDGIRYGKSAKRQDVLQAMYREARTEGFEKEVKRRILLGCFVLSEGYYDTYYLQALKVRTLIQRQLDDILKQCDAIFLPTTLTKAWKIGQSPDPVSVYRSDALTVLANLGGHPAIQIPAGKDDNGIGVGMQLIGKRKTDAALLEYSARINKCLVDF